MKAFGSSDAEDASRVFELLQGKWTVRILCVMREHPVRLSELKREMPLASKKALTGNLRSLQNAGIIVRRDLSKAVLHVEYALSEQTRGALVGLIDKLAEYGALYRLKPDD